MLNRLLRRGREDHDGDSATVGSIVQKCARASLHARTWRWRHACRCRSCVVSFNSGLAKEKKGREEPGLAPMDFARPLLVLGCGCGFFLEICMYHAHTLLVHIHHTTTISTIVAIKIPPKTTTVDRAEWFIIAANTHIHHRASTNMRTPPATPTMPQGTLLSPRTQTPCHRLYLSQ